MITLDKHKGSQAFITENEIAKELCNEAERNFNIYRDHYSAQRIRVMVNKILQSLAPTPVFKKLEEIKNALKAKFFEREEEVEGILVALLSRQHMLMIGPAGTAKSALSVELAKIVQGTEYFQ